MLCLGRRRGQVIRIGENILVRVLDIEGDKVRLGIECPREIRVDREEIRAQKEARIRERKDGGQ